MVSWNVGLSVLKPGRSRANQAKLVMLTLSVGSGGEEAKSAPKREAAPNNMSENLGKEALE